MLLMCIGVQYSFNNPKHEYSMSTVNDFLGK